MRSKRFWLAIFVVGAAVGANVAPLEGGWSYASDVPARVGKEPLASREPGRGAVLERGRRCVWRPHAIDRGWGILPAPLPRVPGAHDPRAGRVVPRGVQWPARGQRSGS